MGLSVFGKLQLHFTNHAILMVRGKPMTSIQQPLESSFKDNINFMLVVFAFSHGLFTLLGLVGTLSLLYSYIPQTLLGVH